jgi:hypothetical protein
MIGWKCLPGILYQTEGEVKTTERQRVCVRGKALRREGDGVGNKIDY